MNNNVVYCIESFDFCDGYYGPAYSVKKIFSSLELAKEYLKTEELTDARIIEWHLDTNIKKVIEEEK